MKSKLDPVCKEPLRFWIKSVALLINLPKFYISYTLPFFLFMCELGSARDVIFNCGFLILSNFIGGMSELLRKLEMSLLFMNIRLEFCAFYPLFFYPTSKSVEVEFPIRNWFFLSVVSTRLVTALKFLNNLILFTPEGNVLFWSLLSLKLYGKDASRNLFTKFEGIYFP